MSGELFSDTMLFDASKRDVCVARRQSTSTPLQALVLWNDPQFVEAARVLARRAVEAEAGDAARVDALAAHLTLALDVEERDLLLALLEDLTTERAEDPEGVTALLSVGSSPPWTESDDESLSPARRAAWTLVASTLLAHPEVVETR